MGIAEIIKTIGTTKGKEEHGEVNSRGFSISAILATGSPASPILACWGGIPAILAIPWGQLLASK